tara:strand:+ start:3117 stop:3533 length:417 start_codon:yes stop_codon:yes gene_type:complete
MSNYSKLLEIASGFNELVEQSEKEELLNNFTLEALTETFTNPVDNAKDRKETPIFSGVLKYFPDALAEVAKCSFRGQQQHNPNKPLAWDRSKSGDEYDALTRHLIDSTEEDYDTDGTLHLAKVAWRALAGLQKHLESK